MALQASIGFEIFVMKWPYAVNIWLIIDTSIFAISITLFQLRPKLEVIVHLKQQFNDDRNYLNLDFKIHMSRKNRVEDHCSTFALSDPDNPS